MGLDALPGAPLQPEQDLHGHRRVQAGEADLPGSRDRRLGQPPGGLVGLLAGAAQAAQPLQVRIAVGAPGGGKLPRARRHRTDTVGGQRGHTGPGGEGVYLGTQPLLLAQVLRA